MGNLWLLGEGDHFFKSVAPRGSTMVSEWPHMQEWVGLKNKKTKTQNLGLDGKVEVDQRGAGK